METRSGLWPGPVYQYSSFSLQVLVDDGSASLVNPVLTKTKSMKNIFKLLNLGISLTIIGVALAALSFVSYLMSNDFVSIVLLPAGIILFVTGWLLTKRAKKRSASN